MAFCLLCDESGHSRGGCPWRTRQTTNIHRDKNLDIVLREGVRHFVESLIYKNQMFVAGETKVSAKSNISFTADSVILAMMRKMYPGHKAPKPVPKGSVGVVIQIEDPRRYPNKASIKVFWVHDLRFTYARYDQLERLVRTLDR